MTEKMYEIAKDIYAQIGVDTDKAIERLKNISISMNCWQGDDVSGFLFKDNQLSGGIQAIGNYPGKANNVKQLMDDIEFAMKLIPGNYKVNLHSIYADTDKKVDLNELLPEHFHSWVDWANKLNIGLDFNPTCFSHPMSDSGFTVASNDKTVRDFWIEHCRRCRVIGEYFGKQTGKKCITNFWFPDGYKDTPIDRDGPRQRMSDSLDKIFSYNIDEKYNVDSIESKLFGIGAESYTVGSNEFVLGYAVKNKKMICLDSGHFHPTEVISDKISSVLLFTDELLLHVSRPVRWDSDHVVCFDDELLNITHSLIRTELITKTHIGLDYFDASINRIAAWVIGMRNVQKALLFALLEPTQKLMDLENNFDYTSRLALTEELKAYPFNTVWDYYCELMNVPVREQWLSQVKKYEYNVLSKR